MAVADADLVAAGFFGGVHGRVGVVDHLFGGHAGAVGDDADADGYPAARLAVFAGEAVGGDGPLEAEGGFAGFVLAGAAHEEEEFLAAEAAEGVAAAGEAREEVGELGEQDVALDVAVFVVVFFEVVDVEHEDGEGLAAIGGEADFGLELFHHVGGVVEAGFGVAVGEPAQVVAGVLQFVDDAEDFPLGGQDDAQRETVDGVGEAGAEEAEEAEGEEGGEEEVVDAFDDFEGAVEAVVVSDGGAGGHVEDGRRPGIVFVGEDAGVGEDSEGDDGLGVGETVGDFDEARDVEVPEFGVVVDGEPDGVGEEFAAQVGGAVTVGVAEGEVGGGHGNADDDPGHHREEAHSVGELAGEADAVYHLVITYWSGVPPLSVMMAWPSGELTKAMKALARSLRGPLWMKERGLT